MIVTTRRWAGQASRARFPLDVCNRNGAVFEEAKIREENF
jgi:hypothetical protein